ncbi:MAG: NAD-dependent malic enzyme, partial [Gammaproteobacteria bacterium]|nr:NAD-dependent malic enzyme [Gammaproteobacteria bacterium]
MSEDEEEPKRIPVNKTGYDLVRDPLLNKGTAFTDRERDELGLHGLLPVERNSQAQQAKRVIASLDKLAAPLDKYVRLSALQNTNEYLYYRVLMDHMNSLLPVVYTPTVGLATQNFSQVFRRGRGIWITPNLAGRVAEVLRRAVGDRDVRLIVATDNESILGIGDQGAGGMAISIGKLALYVAGAGIAPWQTLPISLDVGTNNPQLLNDEFYLGLREPRLRGRDYDALIDEFVLAVQNVFPGALIQWEDFRKDNALDILDRHRDSVLSFNDDIQGTGAVALAALFSAIRITGVPLEDQRLLIFGAGAAGLGIARQIRAAMGKAGKIGVLDSKGLLVDDREIRDAYKKELALPSEQAIKLGLADREDRGLETVVGKFQPTMLVGSSGQAGAFTEAVVRNMADNVERPLILPFSNPTDRSEATPEDIIRWTDGRALIATGSPFEPVMYKGEVIRIGQGNNVFIFPGLGLGALVSGATVITDGMVGAAANALAEQVTENELREGLLFPAVSRLREVSRGVAVAVAKAAQTEGVTGLPEKEIEEVVDAAMWWPVYPHY